MTALGVGRSLRRAHIDALLCLCGDMGLTLKQYGRYCTLHGQSLHVNVHDCTWQGGGSVTPSTPRLGHAFTYATICHTRNTWGLIFSTNKNSISKRKFQNLFFGTNFKYNLFFKAYNSCFALSALFPWHA
jgi:hypothetical protein